LLLHKFIADNSVFYLTGKMDVMQVKNEIVCSETLFRLTGVGPERMFSMIYLACFIRASVPP
jgi:hypothetical protein